MLVLAAPLVKAQISSKSLPPSEQTPRLEAATNSSITLAGALVNLVWAPATGRGGHPETGSAWTPDRPPLLPPRLAERPPRGAVSPVRDARDPGGRRGRSGALLRRGAGASRAVRVAAVRAAREADGVGRRSRGGGTRRDGDGRAAPDGGTRRRKGSQRRGPGACLRRATGGSLAIQRRPARRRPGRAARSAAGCAVVGRRRPGEPPVGRDATRQPGRDPRHMQDSTEGRQWIFTDGPHAATPT